MTTPLYHLAYLSRRSRDVTDDDVVDGIVLPAMSKNRRLDVTGCLWFSADQFLQVLEGAEPVIVDLFEEIRVDHRHREVEVLASEPIDERQFARFNIRALTHSTPESIQQLISTYSVGTSGTTLSNDIQVLVKRVISDLSAWPEGPGPATSLA